MTSLHDLSQMITPTRDGEPPIRMRRADIVSLGDPPTVALDDVAVDATMLGGAGPLAIGDTVFLLTRENELPLILGGASASLVDRYRLRRVAPQNIAAGASAVIGWDTTDENTGGWSAPGGSLTVPRLGSYSFAVRAAVSVGHADTFLQFGSPGGTHNIPTRASAVAAGALSGWRFNAGQGCTITLVNGASTAITMTAEVQAVRVA